MKNIFVLVVLVFVLFGCSSEDSSSRFSKEDSSDLRIRLSNASKFNFQNITVNTTTGNVNFENVDSGQKTKYKGFSFAYSYAFVELQIDGKTYTLQPIDYVGETPLEKGNYTYEITANDSQNQYGKLNLKLIKD
ncbi:hypothetical protein SAMN06265349_104376 [Flavobacterium resistens]|uniref:Uncharacterized protein n=1 Tax=Flavobacterium resistens TaxID=443612 RepID=A0A521ECZ2_9FLAO|nr:hypothetical protein [Flavobacterium resistens]MRX68947.1 hypothetical protein [Flavobacterium resistens]SMO81785.1 hypothetical protein SAMN06265349_104376 [Flavobacterium resistens]